MELFDLIKVIFTEPDTYKKVVTANDKRKHMFILNRFFSINYPVHACLLNINKINPVAIVDWWQSFLYPQYKKVPNWIYTKTKKTNKQDKEIIDVSDDLINKYCIQYGYDKKSVLDCIKFFGNNFIKDELKNYEKMINDGKDG